VPPAVASVRTPRTSPSLGISFLYIWIAGLISVSTIR
jgi:hypothetical protein